MTIDYYQASKRESWRRDLTAVETGANPGGNAAAGESVEGRRRRARTYYLPAALRGSGEWREHEGEKGLLSFLASLFAPFGFDAHCAPLRVSFGVADRGPRRRNWSGDWGAGWCPALAALPASLWVHLHSTRDATMPLCWLTGKAMAAGFGRWSKVHQRFQEMPSTLSIPTTVMC